jgi:hypothetical protein
MPAQQPLAHRPGAARLLEGRLGFAWFLSQHWFQAEVRAGRLYIDDNQPGLADDPGREPS